MSPDSDEGLEPPDEPVDDAAADDEEESSTDEAPDDEPADEAPDDEPDAHVIDLVPDVLALARSQVDAGLPGLAEGTVRRRLARLEADAIGGDDEPDALRVLLAEALWRQGRLAGARQALDAVRAGSPQRRLPIALLVEAESLAAMGERDRATGAMERVIAAVGVDAANELRGDLPSAIAWPLPSSLAPRPPEPGRAPWAPRRQGPRAEPLEIDDERVAIGRSRLEDARVAYVAGELDRGDGELSLATRLAPSLAADGVAILEPTLGGQPPVDRLLLYGDLLRAAGREVEANEAYDRAAGQRG